jgi:hypothetical protein
MPAANLGGWGAEMAEHKYTITSTPKVSITSEGKAIELSLKTDSGDDLILRFATETLEGSVGTLLGALAAARNQILDRPPHRH